MPDSFLRPYRASGRRFEWGQPIGVNSLGVRFPSGGPYEYLGLVLLILTRAAIGARSECKLLRISCSQAKVSFEFVRPRGVAPEVEVGYVLGQQTVQIR